MQARQTQDMPGFRIRWSAHPFTMLFGMVPACMTSSRLRVCVETQLEQMRDPATGGYELLGGLDFSLRNLHVPSPEPQHRPAAPKKTAAFDILGH